MLQSIIDSMIPMLYMIPVMLISLTLHECAHGLMALKLGDTTARDAGRLTLNPLKHLDPVGAVMMVIARVGWAKPVPVNPMNFKDPKNGMALVGLAGPLTNLIVAFGAAFPVALIENAVYLHGVKLTTFLEIAYVFCYLLFQANIFLAIFNLIPIPPFDGSRIMFGILPDRYYFSVMRYERIVGMAFIFIFFIFRSQFAVVLDFISSPITKSFLFVANWFVGLFY
ncbi:MAG: site-2 protease family protein [Clostridia bacterium]|nr:site-2 protease family protein [Clostridia bacterium]MDD3092807.1 site-2 protease family protein [Clostridia bacterium]MDD3970549.1 site-2 protease family protein [Clostridia bacterium]MDD4543105.1 site-2 protease family protein [Clostridia bacterium]HPJ75679.1 site-2 protease family protein [Clostridia bacterium]